MSANTKQIRYGEGAVYGSLAYDFNNPELYPDMSYEPAPEIAAPSLEQTSESAAQTAAARSVQSVAPTAILGFICAAVMLILYLVVNIQLTTVSDEAVHLNNQLEELELEQTRLRIAYESVFNLAEIEEYAIGELGMQKPRSDQIYYVDSSAPDKAVVLNAEDDSDTVGWRLSDTLDIIGEYFR